VDGLEAVSVVIVDSRRQNDCHSAIFYQRARGNLAITSYELTGRSGQLGSVNGEETVERDVGARGKIHGRSNSEGWVLGFCQANSDTNYEEAQPPTNSNARHRESERHGVG